MLTKNILQYEITNNSLNDLSKEVKGEALNVSSPNKLINTFERYMLNIIKLKNKGPVPK